MVQGKYEHKPGRFSLFKNDKANNANRPDFTGSGKTPEGDDFRIAVWKKEEGSGPVLSGQIQWVDDVPSNNDDTPF